MSHTNETANLKLPQFIASDKPTWLGDINTAFSRIDGEVGTLNAAVEGAVATANIANNNVTDALTQVENAVQTAGTASNTASEAASNVAQANSLATQALEMANNTATLATQIKSDVDNVAEDFTELESVVSGYDDAIEEANSNAQTSITYAQEFSAYMPDLSDYTQASGDVLNITPSKSGETFSEPATIEHTGLYQFIVSQTNNSSDNELQINGFPIYTIGINVNENHLSMFPVFLRKGAIVRLHCIRHSTGGTVNLVLRTRAYKAED